MNALASMLTLVMILISLWALIVNPSLELEKPDDPNCPN